METNVIWGVETLQSQEYRLSTGIEQELLRDLLEAELMMIGGGSGEVVLG